MDKKNEKLNVEVFDYSTIPKFMQEHGRFCLWKLVMKPGKTKPDKIPYQLNGKRADATNPQHYSSFEDTVEAFAKGDYAGIGIGCFTNLKRCREQEPRSRQSVSIGTLLVQLISRQTKKKRHNLHCRKLCRLFQRLKIPN